MWVAVKIFFSSEAADAFYLIVKDRRDSRECEEDGPVRAQAENDFFHNQRTRGGALRVEREAFFSRLLMHFGNREERHYAGKYWTPHGTMPSYTLKNSAKAAFVHDLIDSCIANGFIGIDSLSSNLLFIRDKGIKFCHVSYFLKEIKTELGPTYAWAGGLLLAVIGTLSAKKIFGIGAILIHYFLNLSLH